MVIDGTRLSWYGSEQDFLEAKCAGFFEFSQLDQGSYELMWNRHDRTITIETPSAFNDCDFRECRGEKSIFEQFHTDIEDAIEFGRQVYSEEVVKRQYGSDERIEEQKAVEDNKTASAFLDALRS